jgi:hypothetical protein
VRSIRRALDCKGCSADCASGGGRGGEGVGERGMVGEAGGVVRGVCAPIWSLLTLTLSLLTLIRSLGEAGGVVRGVGVAYDSCFEREGEEDQAC